ncbi:MAG: LysR family transcriptional regulator [Thermoleophilia bacterium]|nr:LysR family transcriptional regulator [Thermoleophilia bacterium]
MTIHQLTYFLATVEHGSFSGAARSLFLTQPSISEQIRQLEGELGIALFARAGRGLVLTEAGKKFRPEAERVLADVERARDAVAAVRDLRGGTLGFGMFGTASAYLIADLATDFRRKHPDVRLKLVGLNSSEVADQVRNATLEAGLVVLPVDDAGLDVRVARLEELVVISRETSRLDAPVTIEALADAPLILYDAQYGALDPMRRQLLDRAQRAGVTLRPVIEVEGIEAAVGLARRGLGDTIVPRAAISRQGMRGMHFASFAEPLYDTFAFITRADAPLSPAAHAFVQIVERRLDRLSEAAMYAAGTSETD